MPPAKKHIFILSGQSNMSGRGGVTNRQFDPTTIPPQSTPHPSILRFTSTSHWVPATEPLHHDIDLNKPCGIGPGLPFANSLLSHNNLFNPQEEHFICLVPCAVGGTAIKEWAKGSKLYGEMIRRCKEAVGGGEESVVECVLWFQGESDTLCEETADAYKENMERLINNVRDDLELPRLPFIQVAIASGNESCIQKVRKVQLGMDLPSVVCVDAEGLPLNEDRLHLSTEAQVLLGNMLAEAYINNFVTACNL